MHFGVSEARGRRAVPRTNAPLVAILTLPTGDYPAALVDISRTGARVQGELLPPVGEQLTFKVDGLRTPGEVIWRSSDTCAIEFDLPIAVAEVRQLQLARECIDQQ